MTFSRISDFADESTTIGDNCSGCVFVLVDLISKHRFKLFTGLEYIMITAGLGRVGVFISLSKRHLLPKSTGNTQE